MTRKITLMSMMSAIIFILSAIEHMLPPIPFLPPNVKLGLSNIVTMYCVFIIGGKEAVILNVLKSGFALFMRGPVAAALSISGGMLSILVVILLVHIFKNRISYIATSIFGAVFHNAGQLIAVSLILKTNYVLYYFPVLLISGVVMGVVTGILLKFIMPVFHKIFRKF